MIKEHTTNSEWTEGSDMDPRLPTDPEYVEAGALERELNIKHDDLMEFAGKNPDSARCASGNPWTHSSRERLFLKEKDVREHFSR